MLLDEAIRKQAIDPNASYIVQAPAGSGKTELLTQRFLALLARVESPEQIIALTFTKKAAHEMRDRIQKALLQAQKPLEVNASLHTQKTYQLAQAALKHTEKQQWNLLESPHRLRITTIDSLCQTLSRAIPIFEKDTPFANVTDEPWMCYQEAAKNCLFYALQSPDYQHQATTLLTHFDNQQEKVVQLLSEQLSQRDQWLSLIYQARMQTKEIFEHALENIQMHEIERFKNALPEIEWTELIFLVQKLSLLNPSLIALNNWTHPSELNADKIRALSAVLLTSQGCLRKKIDHHLGLKKDACDPATYQLLKTRSQDLFEKLAENDTFLTELLRIQTLPTPTYTPIQWEILQALLTLLPLLVAHLQVIFKTQNTTDFSGVALQAQAGLLSHEGPSDLALYLDFAIHHLLIDEFQDTSMQQFQLIQQLVQGFSEGEAKTLFVVGDPMQSIYRFRGAEVGLFLQAEKEGIGPVRLIPLKLTCNFRSNAHLITWINHHFQSIFPRQNDIESGAISYHAATAMIPQDSEAQLIAYEYASKDIESQQLIDLVQKELTISKHIAILVRSRTQLQSIIQLLRQANIPFQGIDIDALARLPHIQDVWTLTQLLIKPANRLHWLAFFRSPWVGLSLSDIYLLANINPKQSIYYCLADFSNLECLSKEGQIRVTFAYQVLHHAIQNRCQTTLSTWVHDTLKTFHLNHVLSLSEQNDLTQYWSLLEKYCVDGILSQPKAFQKALDKLYAQPTTQAKLQIMTIHKAKGLEFDCVILPCLGSQNVSKEKPLLRWMTLPHANLPLVLVSPLQSVYQENCPIYDYLGQLDEEKERYELQRLFYVAVTRAKQRIYLLDHHSKPAKKSFRAMISNVPFTPVDLNMTEETDTNKPKNPILKRLPLHFYQTPPILQSSQAEKSPYFAHEQFENRILGIAIHALLQWICTNHPSFEDVPWSIATQCLKQYGITTNKENEIKKMIAAVFQSSHGQWLIQKHIQEANEYELQIQEDHVCKTIIIDRTFVENNRRWIIDFKTGWQEASNQAQYQAQLNRYAYYLGQFQPHPISCGLYYIQSNQWITWPYAEVKEETLLA